MGSILKYNTKSFSDLVNSVVIKKKIGYIDAILELCEEHHLDPSSVNKLLSKPIKDKIKLEFQNINLLPKSKSKLSIL